MKVDRLLLDSIEDCMILTGREGGMLYLNPGAYSLLRGFGISEEEALKQNITMLDDRLLTASEVPVEHWEIVYRGVTFHLSRYSGVEWENFSGYLFHFADSMATSYHLAQVLRAVSNYVTVLNLDGYVEVAAGAQTSDEMELNLQGCVGENDIKRAKRPPEETVFHRILVTKAPVKDRLEYSKGKYITWTGAPLCNQSGEVEKIVFVGKDITRDIKSSQHLYRAERQKGAHKAKLQRMKDFLNNCGLVYNSDQMETVIRTAIKAASADVPVMITGESGVGKDVIADVVYENSARKGKPFLPINCAAIPENLVESELFGYEAGAFTGASAKGKAGLFEQADGGTIFLDEVGELPISVQPKLLRALQEGIITRVGGSRDIKVDIRFISATNISSEQLHSWDDFRQDLYYRLNGVTLSIPPLRERREDVLPLAYHFLEYYNQKYEKQVKYEKSALNRICAYPWPGNVRELKNSIEVAVILAENDLITAEQLPGDGDSGDGVLLSGAMDLRQAKALLEEKLVNLSLAELGSITRVA